MDHGPSSRLATMEPSCTAGEALALFDSLSSVRAVEEIMALGGGDEPDKKVRNRRKTPQIPALAALAEALSDHLETRVLVELGRTRGALTIQFATVDDLERIVAMIAPDAAAALREGRGREQR